MTITVDWDINNKPNKQTNKVSLRYISVQPQAEIFLAMLLYCLFDCLFLLCFF